MSIKRVGLVGDKGGFTPFESVPYVSPECYEADVPGYQHGGKFLTFGRSRSLEIADEHIALAQSQDTAIVAERKLTERAAKGVRIGKTATLVGGFVVFGGGVACFIMDKVFNPNSDDATLQATSYSLMSGGISLALGPVQSKIIDKLKDPVTTDDDGEAAVKSRSLEFGGDNVAVEQIANEDCAKRKLNGKKAKGVSVWKGLVFVGGIAMILGGAGCLIFRKAFPASSADDTLLTTGCSLVSAGLALASGPAESKAIDAMKKPVEAEKTEAK
ncbi:MAG: hypothetical protein LBI61_03015 [Puniceicoccales bacterium]|jgi:hypothetical protein|nr:hypothetical protein [Puniceicoccales bacterium]